MILDSLFDNNDDNQNENANIKEGIAKNENLERHKEVQEQESNGKESNDPSAQRNTGARGYTERSNQKDQLENLHIGGSETEPQGGNDHTNAGEQAQGPGFEAEGSYELDHSVRSHAQEFGEKEANGPRENPINVNTDRPTQQP